VNGMPLNVILSVATGSPVAWFVAEIFYLSVFKRRPSHSKNGQGATALTITCIAGTASGPSECMVVSSQNPLVPIGSDPANGAQPHLHACISTWIWLNATLQTFGLVGAPWSTPRRRKHAADSPNLLVTVRNVPAYIRLESSTSCSG
jgi:hypothetical protein